MKKYMMLALLLALGSNSEAAKQGAMSVRLGVTISTNYTNVQISNPNLFKITKKNDITSLKAIQPGTATVKSVNPKKKTTTTTTTITVGNPVALNSFFPKSIFVGQALNLPNYIKCTVTPDGYFQQHGNSYLAKKAGKVRVTLQYNTQEFPSLSKKTYQTSITISPQPEPTEGNNGNSSTDSTPFFTTTPSYPKK